MNILLWVLQILLALHAVIGAMWKFSNSEQTVPALQAIPHGVWLAMGVLELLCGLGLILPAFNRSLVMLAPVAAAWIVAEMLLLSGLNIFSSSADYQSMTVWLVVAALSAFVACGRFARKPA